MNIEEYQASARLVFDKYISKLAILVVGAISIIVPSLQMNKGIAVDYIEIILLFLSVSALMLVYYFLVRWIFVSLPAKLPRIKNIESDSKLDKTKK